MSESDDVHVNKLLEHITDISNKTSTVENDCKIGKDIIENLKSLCKKEEKHVKQCDKINLVNQMKEELLNYYRNFMGFEIFKGNGNINFCLTDVLPQKPHKKCTLELDVNDDQVKYIDSNPKISNIDQLISTLNEKREWSKFILSVREQWKKNNKH